MPPRQPGSEELFGIRWTDWAGGDDPTVVETWRGDEDLLGRTLSGAALPVGQLEIRKYCGLTGEHTPLATLRGGAPLVARVPTKQGGVYFLATTPAIQDSSLATNGVVLYAFVQRALEAGVAVLGKARQLNAGITAGEVPAEWTRISDGGQGLSTEYPYHRGVYSSADRLLAVNRPAAEDETRILADARVTELFRGLDFVRVNDQAGSLSSLIQEIWRAFMTLMLIALILEAALCLPKLARPNSTGGTA